MIERWDINADNLILLRHDIDDNKELKFRLLSDATFMSPLLQTMIPILFTHLFDDRSHGHDFSSEDGIMYEMKNFTKNGANLRESRHVGSAGKGKSRFNPELDIPFYQLKWNDSFYYILTDITDPPSIQVYIARVTDLLKTGIVNLNSNQMYGTIKYSNLELLREYSTLMGER
jgi:hypothetical protein